MKGNDNLDSSEKPRKFYAKFYTEWLGDNNLKYLYTLFRVEPGESLAEAKEKHAHAMVARLAEDIKPMIRFEELKPMEAQS
jgi:hypothetical protein